jgi:hypothetical protein
MSDFVFNPRRAPRAPVRCRAEVASASGARWSTETEDVGPRGCQIVAPARLPQGEPLSLVITTEGFSRSLRVGGTVAWASGSEPWRLGISYVESDSAVARDWYDALVAKNPALAAYRGVPERISVDATLFLGPPPKLVMDFTNDEIQILRCIGSGLSVGELRHRLKDIWNRAQHALFSLIVRRHLVLSRGASVLPASWKQILVDLEATLAAEELERSSPRAPTPPPVQPAPPPPPPRPQPIDAGPPPSAPASSTTTRASMRAIDQGAGWHSPHVPVAPAPPAGPAHGAPVHRDFQGAGVGWRKPARPRSPEADQYFREALLDAEAGKVDQAIALLRQALALSPGDPEIAAALGKLAFRNR